MQPRSTMTLNDFIASRIPSGCGSEVRRPQSMWYKPLPEVGQAQKAIPKPRAAKTRAAIPMQPPVEVRAAIPMPQPPARQKTPKNPAHRMEEQVPRAGQPHTAYMPPRERDPSPVRKEIRASVPLSRTARAIDVWPMIRTKKGGPLRSILDFMSYEEKLDIGIQRSKTTHQEELTIRQAEEARIRRIEEQKTANRNANIKLLKSLDAYTKLSIYTIIFDPYDELTSEPSMSKIERRLVELNHADIVEVIPWV
jgi:hypothetical protein